MHELERRIARLEAIEEIKALKARYACACDPVPDADAVAELFIEDGVFNSGEAFGEHHGREAIRAHFARGRELLLWAHHVIAAPVIEVAEDLQIARGSWYLWQAMTTNEQGSARRRWLCGQYDDAYSCDADGCWRFASVVLNVSMYATYEEGWGNQANEEMETGA